MITIEGGYESRPRLVTGLWSFDHALSSGDEIGLPLNSLIEVYGATHIGKSTLAYYLSGLMGKDHRILICDMEGIDIDYLPKATAPGFDGIIEIMQATDNKGKVRSHEEMLKELADRALFDEDVKACIVDSVGAIYPQFEQANDIGAGFGAKRAVIVAGLARAGCFAVNNKQTPVVIFVINHSHQVVGGVGHMSAGGVTMKHLAPVRMFLRHSYKDFIKVGNDVIVYTVMGIVEKLRYGGKGRTFKVCTIPGYGVRPNLTAVIDAADLGLATRSTTVKIRDKSFGYISKMVEKDLEGDDEFFEPFHEALRNYKGEDD